MDFVKISMHNIGGEGAEAVSDLFNRYGYGGAVVEMIPPDFELATVHTVVAAEDDGVLREIEVVLALMSKALPDGLPEPEFKFVGENDWAESWKENFHVVRVDPRIIIQPSWREYDPGPDDVVIHLDPGAAFGSGLHPTSRLCLKILQQISVARVDMLDVGTGSGILSIAAAKMGASPVCAVDVDEVAIRVARENFALNDLSYIETVLGSVADSGARQWSLVVANILSNILIEIMADLESILAPHGRLILSGIINEQEQPMLDCLAAHDLIVQSRHIEGDWVAFVVKKRQS